jgi:outer membrane protein insertion porin family
MKLRGQNFVRLGLANLAFAASLAWAIALGGMAGQIVLAGPAMAQSASSIVVVGNRRVDADTIRSYFRVNPGERLDQFKIDEGVKALFATGLFSDVRVSGSGGRLVVTVSENLVINRVAFEGNRAVKDEVLSQEVQSRSRGPFSQAIVQADVQRILDIYRRGGRFDVSVEPKTIDQPNGRVDLVFEVNEGRKTGVRRIEFVGNRAYSDGRLRDIINTGTTNWLTWLRPNDVFDPDRVEADKELLRRHYLKNGYADVRIVSGTGVFDQSLGGFALTFTIDEGEQYRFGTIDVQVGVRDVNPAELRGRVKPSAGAVYNAEHVEKTVENLAIEMARRGYAFAQVRPRGDRDMAQKRINIVFVIEEGSRAYIERINIRGNTRTRDYVIRREFDIAEGDAFNRVLIDRAERRLRNLGYFKNVRVSNEQGSTPDRVIVNVEVEDQPTGEFAVSGGYSSVDGFVGEVSVAERNFLGRGQFVKVAAQLGERTRGVDFSFTEPYFMGYRVSAGIDLYSKLTEESQYQSYDTRTTGGTLRLGLPLNEEWSMGLRYSLFQREISLPSLRASNESQLPGGTGFYSIYDCGPVADPLCRTNGELSAAFKQLLNPGNGYSNTALVSQIGYSLAYNTLDNNQQPRNGILAELRQDLAGLGGDVNFLRTTVDARYFYEFIDDYVFVARGQAGHVTGWGSKEWRILDGFFMGPNLVRGFASSGIGPRDISNSDERYQDGLGGTMYWGVSAEIQFPMPILPREFGMRAAAFADAGSVWDFKSDAPIPGVVLWDENVVRSSVGLGVIWSSPFGPIRLDYAWALSKGEFDKTQAFRFSGGTRF